MMNMPNQNKPLKRIILTLKPNRNSNNTLSLPQFKNENLTKMHSGIYTSDSLCSQSNKVKYQGIDTQAICNNQFETQVNSHDDKIKRNIPDEKAKESNKNKSYEAKDFDFEKYNTMVGKPVLTNLNEKNLLISQDCEKYDHVKVNNFPCIKNGTAVEQGFLAFFQAQESEISHIVPNTNENYFECNESSNDSVLNMIIHLDDKNASINKSLFSFKRVFKESNNTNIDTKTHISEQNEFQLDSQIKCGSTAELTNDSKRLSIARTNKNKNTKGIPPLDFSKLTIIQDHKKICQEDQGHHHQCGDGSGTTTGFPITDEFSGKENLSSRILPEAIANKKKIEVQICSSKIKDRKKYLEEQDCSNYDSSAIYKTNTNQQFLINDIQYNIENVVSNSLKFLTNLLPKSLKKQSQEFKQQQTEVEIFCINCKTYIKNSIVDHHSQYCTVPSNSHRATKSSVELVNNDANGKLSLLEIQNRIRRNIDFIKSKYKVGYHIISDLNYQIVHCIDQTIQLLESIHKENSIENLVSNLDKLTQINHSLSKCYHPLICDINFYIKNAMNDAKQKVNILKEEMNKDSSMNYLYKNGNGSKLNRLSNLNIIKDFPGLSISSCKNTRKIDEQKYFSNSTPETRKTPEIFSESKYNQKYNKKNISQMISSRNKIWEYKHKKVQTQSNNHKIGILTFKKKFGVEYTLSKSLFKRFLKKQILHQMKNKKYFLIDKEQSQI